MPNLDIRTLVLTSALIAGALGVVSLLLSRHGAARALRIWGWGLLVSTAGLLVHGSRGLGMPEFVAVVLGNGLLFSGLLAAHRSVAHVTGRDGDDPIDMQIVIVGIISLAVLYFTIDDIRPRGVLFSVIALILLTRTALSLHLGSAPGQMWGRMLTLLVLYGWAGTHLVRAVYLAASPPWEVFLAANALTAATFLLTAVFALAATIGIAAMQWTTALAVDAPVYSDPPLETPKPPRAVVHGRAEPAVDGKGRGPLVFLVDDNPDFLSITAYALEQAGYRVSTARNADEASRAILLRRPKPDAVVTDVVMPGRLSGIGLALELRADYPGIAIVLLTGYPRSVESEDARGFAVVQKPVSIDALVKVIESERARGEQIRQAAALRAGRQPGAPPTSARASDR